MTIFGNDASKWQGDVRWAAVDQTMDFGFEKCTEGPGKGLPRGYISERWGPEKPEMRARAEASGFIPGAYLFLAEGDGARQADLFADAAGNMDGFAIAVDVEPREATGSHPTMSQARACVARLRARYPGHPIGGYIPKWYWGNQSTTFVDWLWASHYVQSDPGPPGLIYRHVPLSWWAPYGGQTVDLLQFTDKAVIAGVDGPSDCSAYRGSRGELARLVLGSGGSRRLEGKRMALKRVWIASPNHSPRGGSAVRLIVLHTTEGAQSYQSLGAFFANPASQVSSHVGIDDTPGTVGEYVKRDRAAWTAGNANMVAVQAEFCTPSGAADGWTRAVWMGQHRQMLVNAAAWIAEEAKHYGIPITELSPAQAQGGGRGVCQHSDLGAWGGGHHDCGGGFPMDYVISLAKGGAQPAPADEEIDDMPFLINKGKDAKTPVAIPNNAKRLRLFSNQAASVRIDFVGDKVPATATLDLSYAKGALGAATGEAKAAVLTRLDDGLNDVSAVISG